jgi:hypothetical protein
VVPLGPGWRGDGVLGPCATLGEAAAASSISAIVTGNPRPPNILTAFS